MGVTRVSQFISRERLNLGANFYRILNNILNSHCCAIFTRENEVHGRSQNTFKKHDWQVLRIKGSNENPKHYATVIDHLTRTFREKYLKGSVNFRPIVLAARNAREKMSIEFQLLYLDRSHSQVSQDDITTSLHWVYSHFIVTEPACFVVWREITVKVVLQTNTALVKPIFGFPHLVSPRFNGSKKILYL